MATSTALLQRLLANTVKISDVENVARLQAALSGKAAEAVKGHLLYSGSLAPALDQLRVTFGNPVKIMQYLEQDTLAAPKVDADGRGLQILVSRTSGLVSTLMACGMESELRGCSLVNTLQSKLPFSLGIRWGEFCGDSSPTVLSFNTFLKRELGYAIRSGQDQVNAEPKTRATVLAVHVAEEEEDTSSAKTGGVICAACGDNHWLARCDKFSRMTPEQQIQIMTKKQVCFRCLR